MMTTLALLLLLAQDPKPAAKTVEDRLKELAERVEALDKKAAALSAENQKLQLQAQEAQARRDLLARQQGSVWIKRYGPILELSEKQSAEIEQLWVDWTKQEFPKPSDAAGWKAREEILRRKLTGEQADTLARKIHEEQSQGVTATLKNMVHLAKLPSSAGAAFEKVIRPKVTVPEGVLLPAAHAEKYPSWIQIVAVVEANLAELSKDLSESEAESLRKAVTLWKPKPR
jgi:hypothetical protein